LFGGNPDRCLGAAREATIFLIPVATETEAEIIAAVIKVIEDGDFHIGAEAAFCRLLREVRVGIR
jgi:hypothetical protein